MDNRENSRFTGKNSGDILPLKIILSRLWCLFWMFPIKQILKIIHSRIFISMA